MPNWDKQQTLYHAPGKYIIQADCWALIWSGVHKGGTEFIYAYVLINGQQVVKGYQYNIEWSFESYNFVPVKRCDVLEIQTDGPTVHLLPCFYETTNILYTKVS